MQRRMKVICYIVALLCLIDRKISSTSINVGTVLFTPSDTSKNCWSDYEISLLTARRIMQDVLPEPKSIDFSNPSKIICVLLEYFQSCYETIGKNSCGTTQRIMYLAYSDALGGYLRAVLLPIVRRAFYAGQITYADARKVYQLFDDVKSYLKTMGVGWAKPQGSFGIKFSVKPLKITKAGNEHACSKLYLIEKSKPDSGCPGSSCLKGYDSLKKSFQNQIQKFHGNSRKSELKEPVKESKLAPNRHSSSRVKLIETKGKIPHENSGLEYIKAKPLKENKITESKIPKAGNKIAPLETRKKRDDDGNGENTCGESQECPMTTEKPGGNCSSEKPPSKTLIVPLPMLDDCKKPHTIALPFKTHPLRCLTTRSSAFIVQRFYVTVVKCLCSKSSNRKYLLNFNAQFYSWIASEVFPRLGDEEWYPAFGGILKVVETIKTSGYDSSGKKEPSIRDSGYLYEKGVEFEESDAARVEGDAEGDDEDNSMNKRYYIMGMIIMSLIWLGAIIYCCLFCMACRKRNKRSDNCDCSRSSGSLKFLFIIRFFQRMLKKKEPCPEPRQDRRDAEPIREQQSAESRRDEKKVGKDEKGRIKDKEDPNGKNKTRRRSLDRDEKEPQRSLQKSRSQSSTSVNLKDTHKARLDGRGDQIVAKDPAKQQYHVGLTSVWPYKTRPDEKGESAAKTNQVQMLWKKPSSQLGKGGSITEGGLTSDANESEMTAKSTNKVSTAVEVDESTGGSSSEVEGQKVYYVEKSPNTFDYNRACPYSLKNSSGNSSSNTQVKSDFSSTAVDLFDHVVPCHNTFTNTSANTYAQNSDSESESERGPVSSSDSGNSTTTDQKSNSRHK